MLKFETLRQKAIYDCYQMSAKIQLRKELKFSGDSYTVACVSG